MMDKLQQNGKDTEQQEESISNIEQYYDEVPLIEWQRLERHRMEFAVTQRTLTDYLAPAPLAILDNGGGPGRYALDLSARGYQVTLLDLSQANLHFAQKKAREREIALQHYIHGNALDLSSFESQSFDAVLLLGPLYHLQEEYLRQRAVREALRVLRPGGLVFAAFITRYAAFRDLAKHAPLTLIERKYEWEKIMRTGIYHGGSGVGFTDAYFAHPDEICPLFEEEGFVSLDLIGCEGVLSQLEEQVNQLSGEDWQAWVDVCYRLGKEPSLHGGADHLLYVGKKFDT